MKIETPRNWLWMNRKAEVVLVIQNKENKILLMNKKFYPEKVFRLPTGGINENEEPEQAAIRELKEETGITEKPELIETIEYTENNQTFFTSYIFLIKSNQKPACEDENEQITQFKYVTPNELTKTIEKLNNLTGKWNTWGKFRTITHKQIGKKLEG